MRRREFLIGAAAVISTSGGCGSLMYPERCGCPHSRDIDWRVVALDALGLLLFFVPGVVAFVVDFSTGAIYLPVEPCDGVPCLPPQAPGYSPGHVPIQSPVYLPPPPDYPPPAVYGPPPVQPTYPMMPAPGTQASFGRRPMTEQPVSSSSLRRVVVPCKALSPRCIEEVVSRQTGRTISLAQENTRLSPLVQLDDYAEHCRRHRADRTFGFSIKSIVNRLRGA